MGLVLPTVSSLQRATACTASVVLEQLESSDSSVAATRGTRIGAVIAAYLREWQRPDTGKTILPVGCDRADFAARTKKEKGCGCKDAEHHASGIRSMAHLRAYLGEGDVLCELAMSLRADGTVEDLGENIGREYNRPGCINGAADIVVVRRHALVIDVKTGTYPVPQPADNWQVAGLSSMVPVIRGVESVTGVVAKLSRDGEWDFGEPKRWSLNELADIRGRLLGYMKKWRNAQLLSDAGFAEPERVQGSHCFFCKAHCEFNRNAQRSEAA